MTTLSKEDIVRMAEKSGLQIEGRLQFAYRDRIEHFATLVRADLEQSLWARDMDCSAKNLQVSSLVAENERLKNYLSGERDKLLDTANTIDQLTDQLINQLTATRTALAAAEADNERLREDFKCAANYVDFMGGDSKNYRQSIAQPRDDSALRRLLAEAKAGVYEECAKVCENSDRYRGDYFAAKIRELTEKAKEEKC